MLDDVARLRALYLDMMERILCNTVYGDASLVPSGGETRYDRAQRAQGRDWPAEAFTMIGLERWGICAGASSAR